MGGRGASSGMANRSKDGVIIGGKPREIESYLREARGYSPGYHKDEILEATTDGRGNLTFRYARAEAYEKTAKTNRTVNTKYRLQAGAVNGETFGINWDKVKSIQGQTYNLRNAAKEHGMVWDGKNKRWVKK